MFDLKRTTISETLRATTLVATHGSAGNKMSVISLSCFCGDQLSSLGPSPAVGKEIAQNVS